jgi:hypothetical protein
MKRSETVLLLITGSVALAACRDRSVHYPAAADWDGQDPVVQSGTLGVVEGGSQSTTQGGSGSHSVRRGGFGTLFYSGG